MLPRYPQQPLQNPFYQTAYQPRIAQLEAVQSPYASQYEAMPAQQPPTYLRGRPVVSLEEARAAQIDLDGSLFVFTDIANNKIYTKQINLDGIAVLKTYSLVEDNEPTNDFVTKAELNQILTSMKNELLGVNKERNAEHYESTNEQQFGTTKKTVREQPTF